MGPDNFFFDPGRVKSAIYSLSLENFPKKSKNFQLYALWVKKSHRFGSKTTQIKDMSASYLLRVKSMIGSGQGPSLGLTL